MYQRRFIAPYDVPSKYPEEISAAFSDLISPTYVESAINFSGESMFFFSFQNSFQTIMWLCIKAVKVVRVYQEKRSSFRVGKCRVTNWTKSHTPLGRKVLLSTNYPLILVRFYININEIMSITEYLRTCAIHPCCWQKIRQKFYEHQIK